MIEATSSDRNKVLGQMAAIAGFGDHAFRTDDLQALLEDAVSLAAQGSGVDQAAVLEVVPDGTLFLRAGTGWEPDLVGRSNMPGGRQSPAGYALLAQEPVISEDLGSETIEVPDLLRRHGIKSTANVIIKGADTPFGVLEVSSRDRRRFTQDDIHFLQGYANLLAATIHRLRTNQKLQAAANEKALLLRELQHRVKNNLQTITSIVQIQRALARNPEAQRGFDSLTNRLTALGLVHKQLFARDDSRALALDRYIEELCSNLFTAGNLESDDIKLDLSLQRVVVTLDLASSIGLIVNEFITNSLQHAFPDRRGTIRVALAPTGPDPTAADAAGAERVQLVLSDDGTGTPPQTKAKRHSGLGLQLINSLVNQINGIVEWGHERGTRATITFPV